MERYGYVRVSTKDQNPERQIIALRERNVPEQNIFLDRMSGQNFARPAYLKLLENLQKGDIIIIKSIDRLGRNYSEILEQWRKITKEKEADIQVIDMPLLNTNCMDGELTGVFIADLVLQILAYVAETERSFIKQRQAEGIAAAKSKGISFGRKRKTVPPEFQEYCQAWENREITIREAAEQLNMSYATFYRKCLERKNGENCFKK